MAKPFDLLSVEAQDALQEFSLQFDGALAIAPPSEQWSVQLGFSFSSTAIQTTYPIPVDAAGYKLREGDDNLRDLFQKSLTIVPEEWTDGVQASAKVVEAPDFIGWAGAPARIANEGARHPNTLVADLLAANPILKFDGIAWFASNHPVNVFQDEFGTFDNDHTASAVDDAMVSAAKTRFRQRKGPNGKPLGLQLTHFLVPAAREQEFSKFFENDTVVEAVQNVAGSENVAAVTQRNRHQNVKIIVSDELTSDDIVYSLALNTGAMPWVVQDGGNPEEIRFDKTDALYKEKGKIGVKYVLLMGAEAALAQSIERIDLS